MSTIPLGDGEDRDGAVDPCRSADADEYTAPQVETVLTADQLARENQYAGLVS